MPYRARVLKPLNWQPKQPKLRPKPRDAGYDRDHRAWRKQVLALYPICVDCRQAPSSHADHVIPIRVRPELRLDVRNGIGRCHSCHSRVTCKFDGGFGNPIREGKR